MELTPQKTDGTQLQPRKIEEVMRLALGGNPLSLDVPASATLEQVEENLSIVVNGYRKLTYAEENLKPVIGRLLLVVKERGLYRPEHRTFTAYVKERFIQQQQISERFAWECFAIAKAFPDLTLKEYEKYGAKRLGVLATHRSKIEEGELPKLLEKSTEMTVDDFRRYMDQRDATAASRTVTCSIRCDKRTKDRWEALLRKHKDRTGGDIFKALLDAVVEKAVFPSTAA